MNQFAPLGSSRPLPGRAHAAHPDSRPRATLGLSGGGLAAVVRGLSALTARLTGLLGSEFVRLALLVGDPPALTSDFTLFLGIDAREPPVLGPAGVPSALPASHISCEFYLMETRVPPPGTTPCPHRKIPPLPRLVGCSTPRDCSAHSNLVEPLKRKVKHKRDFECFGPSRDLKSGTAVEASVGCSFGGE